MTNTTMSGVKPTFNSFMDYTSETGLFLWTMISHKKGFITESQRTSCVYAVPAA